MSGIVKTRDVADQICDNPPICLTFIYSPLNLIKMKKESKNQSAEKSAKKGNVENANPLAGKKVVKDDKKTSVVETKPDPEKEKAINEAEKAVLTAQTAFADAKTKLAEAKANLRKLSGKKGSKESKGPGVIATIFSLVQGAGKKGISKDQIYDKLVELFPDRAGEGMKKTIAVQLPGRMSKEKKVNIVKLETGAFALESK